MTELISSFNTAITIYLYNKHPYRYLKEAYPEAGPIKAEWVNKWLESDLSENPIYRNWKERWRHCIKTADARYRPYIPELAEREPDFDEDMFEKHRGLLKYESSVLIQIKTGKIGLKAFLYRKDILNIEMLFYNCNQVSEMTVHLIIEYQETTKEKQRLNVEYRYIPDTTSI